MGGGCPPGSPPSATGCGTDLDVAQQASLVAIQRASIPPLAIAFLVGAKWLIFPRFILDEGLGYHVDRARGPLLQAVANGVSLNMLGVLALHAFLRRRIRGIRAAVLLASIAAAAFIIYRHKANIGRIRAGNENVFRFGGGK